MKHQGFFFQRLPVRQVLTRIQTPVSHIPGGTLTTTLSSHSKRYLKFHQLLHLFHKLPGSYCNRNFCQFQPVLRTQKISNEQELVGAEAILVMQEQSFLKPGSNIYLSNERANQIKCYFMLHITFPSNLSKKNSVSDPRLCCTEMLTSLCFRILH